MSPWCAFGDGEEHGPAVACCAWRQSPSQSTRCRAREATKRAVGNLIGENWYGRYARVACQASMSSGSAKERDVGFRSFDVGGHRIWAEENPPRRKASVA